MSVVRRVRGLVKHAFLFELAIYVAVWRWIARRPAVPEGATPIPYGRIAAPVIWLFIWGSAIEVVAVDLVVHHYGWTAVRIPLLILGTWSVLWMLGLLASMRSRPHVLTPTELRLRAGLRGEVVVPTAAITGVTTQEADLSSSMRSYQVTDDTLLVGVSGRTNVQLTLVRPTSLDTPRGRVLVERVGLWVDEPRPVAALLRGSVGRVGAPPGAGAAQAASPRLGIPRAGDAPRP